MPGTWVTWTWVTGTKPSPAGVWEGALGICDMLVLRYELVLGFGTSLGLGREEKVFQGMKGCAGGLVTASKTRFGCWVN